MRQLTGTDATFVYLEGPETPMHLTTMYIYDQSTVEGGVFRHKDLLRLIASRLDTSPVFQQRMVHVPFDLDHPYWVHEPNVDLEFHVRHLALPKPQDWRQLCVVAARLHARPLDMKRPPWEINLIEGLDHVAGIPAGSFAILVKYHHAAVDGMTGNDILGGLTDTSPDTHPLPELAPYDRSASLPGPTVVELLARAAVNGVTIPLRLAKQVTGVAPDLARMAFRSVSPGGPSGPAVPRTRFGEKVSPHRVVQGADFELIDFRTIKGAVPGATVNDVVLAVCGGALRKYLLDKDELPEVSLVAAIPVSTRPSGETVGPGNSITVMTAALETTVADPLERLRAVHASTKDAKELGSATGAAQMSELASYVPATAMALAGRLATISSLGAHTTPIGNCVVTNVPGPQVPLYLNGAKLLSTYGFGPLIDGVGLLILATSYNKRLFLSLTSCRDLMPDPQFFAQCLRESFDDLMDAATS